MNSKYILILAILIILVGAVAFVSRNNDTAVVPEESAATSTRLIYR